MRYAVVLIGHDGPLGGRDSLRIVDADTPLQAVRQAHERPPRREVLHAWVHPLTGTAALVDVEVDDPRWGRVREGVSA